MPSAEDPHAVLSTLSIIIIPTPRAEESSSSSSPGTHLNLLIFNTHLVSGDTSTKVKKDSVTLPRVAIDDQHTRGVAMILLPKISSVAGGVLTILGRSLMTVKINAVSEAPETPVFYTNRLFQTADGRGYVRMADDEAHKSV